MRRTSFLLLTFLGLCAFLLCQQCQMPQGDGVVLDPNAEPFQQLSEYQFFTGNPKELSPNKGVLPYDLNSSLFTDYAEKARFVWMPKGAVAKFAADKAFEFPVGTVLIKNFFYYNDKRQPEKGRRIIETRLLVNREGGWDALAYVWNDEQTDATLSIAGDIKEVTWTNEAGLQTTFNYLVPNRNQCKGCHNLDGKLTPIGPKGRNLNKEFNYPDGSVANQHEKWASVGYLTEYDPAADQPKLSQWDRPESGSLHERAMAYLDINCGHCHNPQGPANTSGLNLTVDQPANINLGIFKAPVSAGSGSGGRSYSIVPGHPEASILVYRMQTTDPGAMMPELGRVTVHREGVELMQAWIAGMDERQGPDEGI